MAILDVFKDACTVIGLTVPSTVYGSSEREHVELVALANDMSLRIAAAHDWTVLKTLATLTGNGVLTSFSLPADYKRMLKKARLWSSSTPYNPLTHQPDTDSFLALQLQAFKPTIGVWTLLGSSVNIIPAVPNAATVKFYYVTNLIVKPSTGVNKIAFTKDDDAFLLDEQVLKLGIIWQWRANKGLLYAEDMTNYETALSVAIGGDKGTNLLPMNQRRRFVGQSFAFPGTLGP